MCTALSLLAKDKKLFGRNMDIDYNFGQSIIITPRNFIWKYQYQPEALQKYATIGMAFGLPINNNIYPMYAEACNEKGLAMAGLNFPKRAHYINPNDTQPNQFKLAPYELIPYILSHFSFVKEVKQWIKEVNLVIVEKPIAPNLPTAPLHFIIYDTNDESIVLEQTIDGLKVFDNKLGILSNNPTFDWHLQNLAFYQNLGIDQKRQVNWLKQDISPFGEGFASFGLPGDWTPPSRFVRTAFLKYTSPTNLEYENSISQFFHILDNVAMVKGSIKTGTDSNNLNDDITLYSSCININDGIYYYKTYNNNQINVIDMHQEDLDGTKTISYSFSTKQGFNYINKKK